MDEYDAMFIKLAKYAPHMVLTEEDIIQRFVEGLHDSLFSQVGAQIKAYSSYSVAIDTARRMEKRMKNREELNKRKRGNDGKSQGRGGNPGASKPPS